MNSLRLTYTKKRTSTMALYCYSRQQEKSFRNPLELREKRFVAPPKSKLTRLAMKKYTYAVRGEVKYQTDEENSKIGQNFLLYGIRDVEEVGFRGGVVTLYVCIISTESRAKDSLS